MKWVNYSCNRELYSNYYYTNKGIIIIRLEDGSIRYLYFDHDKHIKFTKDIKYATRFSRKPANYEAYCQYINKCFKNCVITYSIAEIQMKNKYS